MFFLFRALGAAASKTKSYPRDPCIQIIPTLGPKV